MDTWMSEWVAESPIQKETHTHRKKVQQQQQHMLTCHSLRHCTDIVWKMQISEARQYACIWLMCLGTFVYVTQSLCVVCACVCVLLIISHDESRERIEKPPFFTQWKSLEPDICISSKLTCFFVIFFLWLCSLTKCHRYKRRMSNFEMSLWVGWGTSPMENVDANGGKHRDWHKENKYHMYS